MIESKKNSLKQKASVLHCAVLILLSLLVGGCAAAPRHKPTDPVAITTAEKPTRDVAEPELSEEIKRADLEIEEKNDAKKATTVISEHPKLLVQLNGRVEKWIKYFTGVNRQGFSRYLGRGAQYKAMVQQTLKEQGIPKEVYYLAMIESGYLTHAKSTAKAVGIWQFIPATGKRYGLMLGPGIDERRDPVRATRAAAAYLKDLYNVFGSWRLAMAAYNAGEFRIYNAIIKGKARDFWTLAEKRMLPSETMEYVPKFLAAVIIGENPEKYGFEELGEVATSWEAELRDVPSPIRLSSIAQETKVPHSELMRLNPHLLSGVTPTNSKSYGVWFPKESLPLVTSKIASLHAHILKTSWKAPAARTVVTTQKYSRSRSKASRVKTVIYRVRPGDTLVEISSRFGVPVKQIKKTNKLSSAAIFSGQSLKITSL